jgi:YcxB-like protein
VAAPRSQWIACSPVRSGTVAGRSTRSLDRTEVIANMRVEYKVGVLDVVRFNLIHQFLSPLIASLYIGLAVFIFFGELGSGDSPSEAAVTAMKWYVGLWVFQAILLLAYLYTGKADSTLTDHVLEIQERGLFESTRFNESLFFWPSIIKVVRRPGFVAIYIAAHQAHVIPTKAFESSEQMTRFVALIREKKGAV